MDSAISSIPVHDQTWVSDLGTFRLDIIYPTELPGADALVYIQVVGTSCPWVIKQTYTLDKALTAWMHGHDYLWSQGSYEELSLPPKWD